ncbi:ABC transporter ATP-binding protein [Brevibacterium aurantiacum]|uniref:ABC transporter ATP-binding protein n=1 Tax=Brevibacterium aurantiacum TaxID=273384 RepID=A0A556CBS9_BREAU|nr:ABC transporter ATP-binding protein [Brevibacterium aurantiacum]TSI14498.1 ABC transporter ATP-binding protein [Brevibacterium aurantiacum]
MSESSDSETVTALPVAGGRQTWQTVWALSRGRRLVFLSVTVLGVASAAVGLVTPAVIGGLVDRIHTGAATSSTVGIALVALILAAFLGALGTAATVVLAARAYHAMLADLRESLVEQAMSVPQNVIERAGTGDLISRTSDDVSQIADAAPQIIPTFTTVVFTIIVTFAGLTALDPWYGLIVVAVLPVYVFTLRWYLAIGPRVYRSERAAMSRRAQQITESQRGYDTVVGLGLTRQRHDTVVNTSWEVVEHSLRARTVQNMFFGRLNLAEYLGLAVLLVIGFILIGDGSSTIGATTTAMLLFLRLFGPINQLLIVVDTLQSVLASLSRMIGVLTIPQSGSPHTCRPSEPRPADGLARPAHEDTALCERTVRLEGVMFSYDGREPALSDIDLDIETGEHIAVIGASGAGKSTLAAVIAGIHSPDSGRLVCPRGTALVTQEMHVFAGTLRENLTLANPEAGDEKLRAALVSAGAEGLVDLLPEGLDTEVGAGGRILTPAQSQQLALARIMVLDPELVILDEAAAEAGSAQAGLLDQAAAETLRGRTGMVIAHRLSQASVCDRIIVMEGGRIVETGTPDQLREAGGVYARLWSAWVEAQAFTPGAGPHISRNSHRPR